PSAPIIEDWVSDSEEESEPKDPQQFVPSFVQSSEHVKTPRHSVQPIETTFQIATSVPASPKSNSSGKRRNRKACFVCKSVDHLIQDYDYHYNKMAQPTPRNYANRGHHKQYVPLTQSKPQMHRVPTAVLTQSKPVSNTAIRPVSAALPNITVTRPRHANQVVQVVSAAPGKQGTWVWRPKCPILDHDFLTTSASMTLKRFDYNDALGRSNLKVKVIRSDNGTEFKNSDLNQLSTGPTWLFDIDSLSGTMNYHPVTARNQTNSGAGFQNNLDAEKAGEEVDQSYMLFPVWSSVGSINPQNNAEDAAFDGKEHDFNVKKPESIVILSPSSKDAAFDGKEHDFNVKKPDAAGPSNTAVSPTYGQTSDIDASQLPDDPDMPRLEV
nr:hypothetical protein [Tanacetum cinerariifolium]